ncbi:hypothetical protein [Pectobacterium versatile]|jgi:hypothetical protein|uniref:hypothetical protein n=1 Tax=Pectobacterium versatile TaxID=2488639 RepID=UPI001CF46978|nr:hypothetical protein [Pectobacterium versatile]MCA6935394.1 hypothetical protein [Pectobacterium versatile]
MSEASISEAVTASAPEEISVFARRSSEFKVRLERHQQLEKAQEIRDSLLQVARKIDLPVKKLAQILTSYLLLREVCDSESGEPIVSLFDREKFGHPQASLAAFLQQYEVYAYDVAQAQELALLIQEIERLTNELSDHTTTAWRNYTRTLKAQWEVDQKLFSTLAHQEEQRKAQQQYSDLAALFTNNCRGLPKNREEFEAVLALHEQLSVQREALKLDVPEDVNLFLKAVAGQGASLDMLTPNVLSWLACEDDPTRYCIKRL